jgi:hypothetical protein
VSSWTSSTNSSAIQRLEGCRLKLGDTHLHTIESFKNLITLYEAWSKPEKAKEWQAKLQQTEAKIEVE